jgi:very-short-patch-repair endonuclease
MPDRYPQNRGPLPADMQERCRILRRQATYPEQLLWRLLRNRQLNGYKFRRQHVLGRFVLDFYCDQAKLVVEIDGGGHGEHDQMGRDAHRSAELQAQGIRVLRFWNYEVMEQTAEVLEAILRVLEERAPSGWIPSP